jgi:hypothetical protein
MRVSALSLFVVSLSAGACERSSFSAAETAGNAGTGPTGGLGAAAGAGSGGSAGTAGGGDGGTAGAASGGAGEAGKGGQSGSAGASGCACGVEQYCRAGSCRDCSDLSSIDFATPVELLDHPTSPLRFPREGDTSASLFFTVASPGRSELWYTPDPRGSASFPLDGTTTPSRSALLYLDEPGALPFNVVFDEVDAGQRVERSATWNGSTLSDEATLGSPLSPSGFHTYSVAVATRTGRAYWMSLRDGRPALRTGNFGTGNDDLVNVEVTARGGGTCPRSGDDATPWVNPEGTLMLLSAPAVDASCQSLDGGASDLFVVPLDPESGLPLAPATPLASVNITENESSQSDPSFSSDLCAIYFASDGGAGLGYDFRLYRAARR